MDDYTTKIRLQIIKKLFLSRKFQIKFTNNMIVIKTTPGNANSVAVIIDRLGLPEILGTIAGDDTILIVIDADENRKRIETEFVNILEKAV